MKARLGWDVHNTNDEYGAAVSDQHGLLNLELDRLQNASSAFSEIAGKGNCRKGATRKGAILWCDACNAQCDFPRTSYKLHVDVADATCGLVITLFDEIVETLIKKKASKLLEEVGDNAVQTVLPQEIQAMMNTRHTLEFRTNTYYTNGHYESFTASKLVDDDQGKQIIEPTSVGPDGEPAVKLAVKRSREESINTDGCMENTDLNSEGESHGNGTSPPSKK